MSKLKIEKMIVHRILRNETGPDLFASDFSSILSIPPPETRELIEKRLVEAIGTQSKSIEMKFNQTGPDSAFVLFQKMFTDTDEYFIENSQKLTSKLEKCQKRKDIKNSIILIIHAKFSSVGLRDSLIFIKAETDDSLQVVESNDRTAMELKLINNTFLGQEQKLYKVAQVSTLTPGSTLTSAYDVLLFDRNMTYYYSENIAKYFYDWFLGCEPKEDIKKMTIDFYNVSKEAISILSLDIEERIALFTGLNSYIYSPGKTLLDSSEFASMYIRSPEKQDEFTRIMNQHGFNRSIVKCQETASKITKKRFIKFENNLILSGPRESFEKDIKISFVDGKTTLVINSIVDEQK